MLNFSKDLNFFIVLLSTIQKVTSVGSNRVLVISIMIASFIHEFVWFILIMTIGDWRHNINLHQLRELQWHCGFKCTRLKSSFPMNYLTY